MHLHSDPEAPTTYGGRFTGEVRLVMLDEAADSTQPDIARVTFCGDAATYWHSHPGGQRLLVLEGRARIGTADDELIVGPGAFVVAPPGERHYHGAADGSGCTMLAVTWGTTQWEASSPFPPKDPTSTGSAPIDPAQEDTPA